MQKIFLLLFGKLLYFLLIEVVVFESEEEVKLGFGWVAWIVQDAFGVDLKSHGNWADKLDGRQSNVVGSQRRLKHELVHFGRARRLRLKYLTD